MTTVVKILERDTAAPLAASESDMMMRQLNARVDMILSPRRAQSRCSRPSHNV